MIIELNKIPNTGLVVDKNIYLEKEFYKNANILEINKLHLSGIINFDYENNLLLNLEVNGVFLLEDALTLDPIEYPFSCTIDEKIENLEDYCGNFYEKKKNTLDINEILWENIVLEIPIRATHTNLSELNLQGTGWKMAQDEKEKIDPRLAKLTELLDKGKE